MNDENQNINPEEDLSENTTEEKSEKSSANSSEKPNEVTKDLESELDKEGRKKDVSDEKNADDLKSDDQQTEEDDDAQKGRIIDDIVGEVKEEGTQDFQLISERTFQEQTKEIVLPTLLKFFRPELINRFDDLLFFHPLRREDLKKIVEIMIQEPREMLREKNIEFHLSDQAKEFLAERGYNPAFGARPLRRSIQQYLEDPLSDHLIAEDFVSGDTIFIDINTEKDALTFQKDVPDEKTSEELDPFAELEKNKSEEKTEEETSEKGDVAKKQEAENKSEENLENTPRKEADSGEEAENGEEKSFFSKIFRPKN